MSSRSAKFRISKGLSGLWTRRDQGSFMEERKQEKGVTSDQCPLLSIILSRQWYRTVNIVPNIHGDGGPFRWERFRNDDLQVGE